MYNYRLDGYSNGEPERVGNQFPYNQQYFSMANPNDLARIYFMADDRNRVYSGPYGTSKKDLINHYNKLQNYANNILLRQYPQAYSQLQNNLSQINQWGY